MSDQSDAPAGNPLGGMDLGGLLESAQQMMAGMQAAADEVVQGSAGGGLVTVEVDGHINFRSVSIDPKAIDPDDVSLLEDLVLAALRDAAEQLQAGQSERWVALISAGSAACWGASELLLDGSGTHRSTRAASGHRPEVCSACGVSSFEGTERRCAPPQPGHRRCQGAGLVLLALFQLE